MAAKCRTKFPKHFIFQPNRVHFRPKNSFKGAWDLQQAHRSLMKIKQWRIKSNHYNFLDHFIQICMMMYCLQKIIFWNILYIFNSAFPCLKNLGGQVSNGTCFRNLYLFPHFMQHRNQVMCEQDSIILVPKQN